MSFKLLIAAITLCLIYCCSAQKLPKQFDYILSKKHWQCTLYAKSHRMSKVEIDESEVYQYYTGYVRNCVRYERIGLI